MKSQPKIYKCIYCPATSNSRFPHEHVIPESFGKFANSPTLFCVCGGCNSYFANNLELFLARDSYEGLSRLRHGVKPLSNAYNLIGSRLKMKVVTPGPWQGAFVLLKPDEQYVELVPVPVAQVAFQRPGEEWVWIPEESLTPSVVAPFDIKGLKMKFAGPSDPDQLRVRDKVKQLGIKVRVEGILDQPVPSGGKIELELSSDIDIVICRAIAKIAFNYLTHVKGGTFALKDDFDEIRTFVRHGTGKVFPVNVLKRPILFDDSKQWKQTSGHLIMIDWDKTGLALIAMLSLFNTLTYQVTLCHRYSGIWHEITVGHHFDIETRKVKELGSVRLIQLPQIFFR